LLDTSSARVLRADELGAATRIAGRDPVANVFVLSRLAAMRATGPRTAGELWGHQVDGELRALCFSGANLVPVEADDSAIAAFAARAAASPRRCSSIVGRAEQVLGFWDRIEPYWGPAREVRASQPLLALDAGVDGGVRPDPRVRIVGPADLGALIPACVAMFTEEVGVSPLTADGGALYRARVRELVEAGRAYARIEDDEVVFKAEIGAAVDGVCQVQGVWVNPRLRGRGLAAAGMAAVVALARRHVAPVVSLYVNDYNLAAQAVYRRVGFRRVGTFCSVLF
jgi:predicted GNAT family acetyltransferase